MSITLSKKMDLFKASIFTELAEHKQRKIVGGEQIIDLSIGSPDLPPPAFITKALADEVQKNDQYGYTLTGTEQFNDAVAHYYKLAHNVELKAEEEVLLVMGSQDGLVHLPLVFANPGDIILVPDPGYTAYETGIALAGAEPYLMPLKKENEFLPDLSKIPEDIAEKAKLMILNFPGNPVPAMATASFFNEVIAFAKKYNIIVLHDFAYSELYYENKKPISFLSLSGAKDVGVEMGSFSKNYNMAGCRIGYLIGNKTIIEAVGKLKSNLDFGVFLPIQTAAVTALRDGAAFCIDSRKMYEERRDILIDGLSEIGWNVTKPEGGMFVWAEIPKGWTSTEFTYALLDKANVMVIPGNAFGPTGEGYVRIALVQTAEKLKEAVHNIKKSGILNSFQLSSTK
ncbi:LL-diaminopimelate aminotransferase [Metabacillus fastidiosus]|uniref:LL-diaminopimelate aminotransferase n=1 Tax=Metabacillus fastidiosus TaxID=1458 RepID=UPI003D2C6536